MQAQSLSTRSRDRSHLPALAKVAKQKDPRHRSSEATAWGSPTFALDYKTLLSSQPGPHLPSGSFKSGITLSPSSFHSTPTSMSHGPGRRCLALVAYIGSSSWYCGKAERDEDVVARKQKAWSPIRVEGSGGNSTPPSFLPSFLFPFFPEEGGRVGVGREQTFPFLFLGTKERKCGGGVGVE